MLQSSSGKILLTFWPNASLQSSNIRVPRWRLKHSVETSARFSNLKVDIKEFSFLLKYAAATWEATPQKLDIVYPPARRSVVQSCHLLHEDWHPRCCVRGGQWAAPPCLCGSSSPGRVSGHPSFHPVCWDWYQVSSTDPSASAKALIMSHDVTMM